MYAPLVKRDADPPPPFIRLRGPVGGATFAFGPDGTGVVVGNLLLDAC